MTMKLLVIALALYLVGALLVTLGSAAIAMLAYGASPNWALAAKSGAAWPWLLWRMFA